MDEFEVILDFSDEDISDKKRERLIRAIREGKKFKTNMFYYADGDFNSLNSEEIEIVFNTTALVRLATEMGFEMKNEDYTKEEMDEIIDDMNKNGCVDSYNTYLKESKEDFLD